MYILCLLVYACLECASGYVFRGLCWFLLLAFWFLSFSRWAGFYAGYACSQVGVLEQVWHMQVSCFTVGDGF